MPVHEQTQLAATGSDVIVGLAGQVSGYDSDGWLASTSLFELEQPDATATLVVQGKIPTVADDGFLAELTVLVDGCEVTRAPLGQGWFRLRMTVPPGAARRQVAMHFSAIQQLPSPDGRLVGARLQHLSFEPTVPRPGVLAPRIDADAAADEAAPDGDAAARTMAMPDVGAASGPDGEDTPVPAVVADAGSEAAASSERPILAADGAGPAAPARVWPAVGPPPARIFATETVFGPTPAPLHLQLREMWRYRQLFVALVWRNVRVEFDATRLGSVWAIARPILFAIVFGFFRNLSGANTYVEVPYVLYIYSGLLLWTYFTDVATNSASALRSDLALLAKVYYPRLLTPLVPAVSNMITLVVGVVPLLGMMLWYGIHPGWMVILLPAAVLPCIILALGLGLLVSSLSIEDRDWERVLAYGMTIGLWLAPVLYAPGMIPGGFRDFYHLNPMAGPLLAFRAVLFDGVPFPVWEWVYGAVSSVVVLAAGILAFRRAEVRLVDRL